MPSMSPSAGSRELAIGARWNDHVQEVDQQVLLIGGEREGVHQSSNRFARFRFIVSAM